MGASPDGGNGGAAWAGMAVAAAVAEIGSLLSSCVDAAKCKVASVKSASSAGTPVLSCSATVTDEVTSS